MPFKRGRKNQENRTLPAAFFYPFHQLQLNSYTPFTDQPPLHQLFALAIEPVRMIKCFGK